MLINLFLLCSASTLAMQPERSDLSIIPNATYFVCEGNEHAIPTGGIPSNARHATFYTATGDEIQKISRSQADFFELKSKLDPQAPKPQPVTYAIKYWPAIQLGFGLTKGVPGYFIVFRDKHGNHIESYRYDTAAKKICVSYSPKKLASITDLEDLDTSVVQEAESDEIRDHQGDTPKVCIVQ